MLSLRSESCGNKMAALLMKLEYAAVIWQTVTRPPDKAVKEEVALAWCIKSCTYNGYTTQSVRPGQRQYHARLISHDICLQLKVAAMAMLAGQESGSFSLHERGLGLDKCMLQPAVPAEGQVQKTFRALPADVQPRRS